jgi:hypothetical protein
MNTPISNRGGSMGRPSEKPSMPNREARQNLEQKPTSAFGNNRVMERRNFRSWIKKQPEFEKEAYKYYPHLSQDERLKKIEKNIWGSPTGKWGSLIEKNKKEVEWRRKEYEKELHTHKVMENIKEKRTKTFEAGLLDKFMGKK